MVLREDVVAIGFEIEDGALSRLDGRLRGLFAELRQGAGQAEQVLNGLVGALSGAAQLAGGAGGLLGGLLGGAGGLAGGLAGGAGGAGGLLPQLDVAGFLARMAALNAGFTPQAALFRLTASGMTAGVHSFQQASVQCAAGVLLSFTNMANNLRQSLAGLDLSAAGAQIMQGLHNGILSKIGGILATVTSLCGSIRSAVDRAMAIRSPSREMMYRGQMLGAGLALGIAASTPLVSGSAAALSQDAMPLLPQPAAPYASPLQAPKVCDQSTFAPQFTLNVGGTAREDDRSLERKVRQWVLSSFNRMLAAMESGQPLPREV